ncbi:unnamed protein product [Arctia plantaginis]|uniref:Uncharacterized protein n=1 Tax=Arctia plantaginis TaxID=874455 RepID=A0A8S0Z2Q6_ARCPL|nr:unnamed protein product [Arctia plantaginis]
MQSADRKVKRAEIKLAAFIAEHKIAHAVIDHLNDLLPDIFPDSSIATNLKMKHSKLHVVITNVLGSLHLCASDAAKEIPTECEQLARDVYNHFKSNSKRQSQFKAFQNFVEVDVHKILRPAQTRWLSLSSVVDRLLEQWDALRLYFDSKRLDDRECREIQKRLNDPIIKAYYCFLSWMLYKFANANAYFQSESTVITEMHTKMRDLYRNLIKLVMQPECMLDDKLDKIDPTNENLYLNLDDIYLGLGVRKQLSLPEVANNENDIL